MRQIFSVKFPEQSDLSSKEIRKELNLDPINTENQWNFDTYTLRILEKEIECEGTIPEETFETLNRLKEEHKGIFSYEGDSLEQVEPLEEYTTKQKALIVLAFIFFPITLLYLTTRFIWAMMTLKKQLNQKTK